MAYWINVTILLTHGITASICCVMFFWSWKYPAMWFYVLLQHIKSIMQWLISVHGDKLGVSCFLRRKLKINVELCNKNYAAKYVPMFAYVLHKFWPFAHFMTTEIASVFGGLSFILFVSVCVCVLVIVYATKSTMHFITSLLLSRRPRRSRKKRWRRSVNTYARACTVHFICLPLWN